MPRQGDDHGLECEGLIEETDGLMGSGLVGLHMKALFQARCLLSPSRDDSGRGNSSRIIETPRCQSFRIQKIKD